MSGFLKALLRIAKGRPRETGAGGGGAFWEKRAAEFLKSKGLKILARNVRTRRGELDIVALDGEEVVFVEVKARNTKDFGGPAAGLDRRKRRKLLSAAKEFISRERLGPHPCRFDAILIYTGVDPPEIEHIENAFGDETR